MKRQSNLFDNDVRVEPLQYKEIKKAFIENKQGRRIFDRKFARHSGN